MDPCMTSDNRQQTADRKQYREQTADSRRQTTDRTWGSCPWTPASRPRAAGAHHTYRVGQGWTRLDSVGQCWTVLDSVGQWCCMTAKGCGWSSYHLRTATLNSLCFSVCMGLSQPWMCGTYTQAMVKSERERVGAPLAFPWMFRIIMNSLCFSVCIGHSQP
jgi:hypothetical protein